MPRPILARIHLAALRSNLARARALAEQRRIWAVVKANAYGHGIERVLPAFAQADGLALLDLAEAARARAAGWRKPILLLEGFFSADDLELVERLGLSTVVHDDAQIHLLARHRFGQPVDVQVKLNTGMNRLGFAGSRFGEVIESLRACAGVEVSTAVMHFANADVASAETPLSVDTQLRCFEQATAGWSGQRSVANSAALFLQPSAGGDWVRPGIALYGSSPAADRSAAALGLRPAMSLVSRVIAVQQVAVGHTVGYGSRWVARRASRIGIVACGYADGYPRCAPDGTPVSVEGQLVPLAGRVSMDMLTVDLTDLPQARVGSAVELWGSTLPIDRVAESCGTVGYELMCALAQRVPVEIEGE
jgi:alanine racemase